MEAHIMDSELHGDRMWEMVDQNFKRMWEALAEDGECDAWDSAECHRIYTAYKILKRFGVQFPSSRSLQMWITHEANKTA